MLFFDILLQLAAQLQCLNTWICIQSRFVFQGNFLNSMIIFEMIIFLLLESKIVDEIHQTRMIENLIYPLIVHSDLFEYQIW